MIDDMEKVEKKTKDEIIAEIVHGYDWDADDLLSVVSFETQINTEYSAIDVINRIKVLGKYRKLTEKKTLNVADYLDEYLLNYCFWEGDKVVDKSNSQLVKDKQKAELQCGIGEKIDVNSLSEEDLITIMAEYYKTSNVDFVKKVLTDSEEDPEYSAVGTCNCIKKYLRYLELTTGEKSAPSAFLKSQGYTQEDIDLLEQKRAIESEYYEGEQL